MTDFVNRNRLECAGGRNSAGVDGSGDAGRGPQLSVAALSGISKYWPRKYCLATNWSSLQENLSILGCEKVLHLPAGDFNDVLREAICEKLYVYETRPGQQTVLVVSRVITEDDVIRGIPVQKEQW